MLINAKESILLLIDYQTRLMPAIFEGREVLDNAICLAKLAKWLNIPVIATDQNPEKLGENDAGLLEFCDEVVSKMSFSAFEEVSPVLLDLQAPPAPVRGNARSLPKHLQKSAPAAVERRSIVIAGCEAHVCLMQTALELVDDEWDVCVVVDACSSRTVRNRDAAFDRLAGAGCELVTTEMIGFEWLRDCKNPQFKKWLEMIK